MRYVAALAVLLLAVFVGCVELRVGVGTDGSSLESRKGVSVGKDKDASRSADNPN